MTKKRFFIKIISVIFLIFVWYYFLYLPQINTISQLEVKLLEYDNKVEVARNAKINILNMRSRYQVEQQRLETEQAKFIKKQDLGKVTRQLQQLAQKFNLKLVDFSPEFRDYFDKQDEKIIPLPLSITLIGRFLAIGKFIEEWEKLPFYLIPESLILERLDKNGIEIQAVIEAQLYTWND